MTRLMKKILTTLLAVIMILTLPGATVFADDVISDSGSAGYLYTIIYDSVEAIDSITNFPENEEFTSDLTETTHPITEIIPEAQGYAFEGWSVDPSVTDPEALLAAGDPVSFSADNSVLTLYAVWGEAQNEEAAVEAEDAEEAEAAVAGPRRLRAANSNTYTVYLKNDANWANPTVFIWEEGKPYNPTGEWPGAAMTLDSKTGLYYYTFTNTDYPSVGVIFNDGKQNTNVKTVDLSYSNTNLSNDLYSNSNTQSTTWTSALALYPELDNKTIGIDEEISVAVPVGYTITSWTSSDAGIAEITPVDDRSATIKGIKEGSVTITAVDDKGKTLTASVKVIKENAVYFDATLSKLSYKESTSNGYNGGGMPYASNTTAPDRFKNKIFVAFSKSSNGSNHTEPKEMTAPTPVTKTIDGVQHTFLDTYKIEIPAGYEDGYVRFYSKTDGADSLSDNDWYGGATAWMKLDPANNCFYADTSDKTIYDGGLRGGYWGVPFMIRDPEKENAVKSGKDIVTVTGTGSFERKANTLYIDSSFYDYYTDFELNGTNEYYNSDKEATSGSQRSYVRFRQFNQALSDYYGSGTNTKLYEGHFQPSIDGWGNQFKDIQGTLNLNGYSETPAFYSSNNSVMANSGGISNQGRYDDAAWGLVNGELAGYGGKGTGSLLTTDGSEVLPFFNSDFLLGNNSKNTILGNVYSDVKFPFTKTEVDHVDYWEFDSAETTLHMQESSGGQYYLEDVGHHDWSKNVDSSGTVGEDGVSNTYGFFPLNDTDVGTGSMRYNYGFGTRLDFPFKLTADGDVFADDGSGVEKPITFEFSGDDDVWVFIDGKLVMDIGGDHGRTSGVINFSNDGLAYDFKDTTGTKQTTVTHTVPGNTVWVSGVKASVADGTDNGSTGVEKSLSDIVGDLGTGKHVVTMFYMERGQWESNMKVRFNWPDQNDLTVEKMVDTSDVNPDLMSNPEIANIFKNQNFTFGIENLATHYGTKDNGYTAPEPKQYAADSASPATSVVNFTSSSTYPGAYHWSAKTSGTDWPNRYGVLSTPGGFNIDAPNADGSAATRRTLQFSYLYKHTYSGYDMRLDRTSIELEDVNGNKLSGLLSTCAEATTLKRDTWGTMTVDLTKLSGSSNFDYTKLKAIKFAYQDYQNLSFYLKDFVFTGDATGSGETGTSFGVKQNEIADYNSAKSGTLEPANGAEYTKNTIGGGSATAVTQNVSNGQFTLKDNEYATFINDFRRGSYISVTEKNVDETLYTVSWQLSDPNGTTYAGVGTSPEDGRVEAVSAQADLVDTDDKLNNTYSQTYKNSTPDGQDTDQASFVFRNLRNPEDMIESIDITAAVVNKVNTGCIHLKKVQADNSFPINQKYHFKITITDVAGVTLSTPIVYEYDLGIGEKADICGIPLNSNYIITETNPNGEENVSLDGVTKNGEKMDFNGDSTNGYTVTDSMEKIDGENEYNYVFSNIKLPKVDVNLTKLWVDPAGDEYNTNLPSGIYVQLQKKAASEADFTPIDIKGYTITGANTEADGVYFSCYYLKPGTDGKWTATISGLPQYKNNDVNDPYEYRIVEVEQDENGAIATDENNQPKVVSDLGTVTYNGTTYEVQPPVTTDNTNTVLTNKMKASYGFDIKKVNADTQEVLEGVTFALYKDEACTEANRIKFSQAGSIYTRDDAGGVDTLTTSADGVFSVSDLPIGTYYLKELQAKDGFYLFGSPIRIDLKEKSTKDSVSVVDPDKATGTVTGLKWENRTLSFEITNKPGVVLPGTGGAGRNILILLLGGLALIGAFLFWNKKILSERRAKAGHR